MKTEIFVILLLIYIVSGRSPNGDASIIFTEFHKEDPYSYQFKYETSNGIAQAETGDYEETGKNQGVYIMKGYYTYLGPDNIQYTVTYVADENGFRPKIHRSDKKQPLSVDNVLTKVSVDGVDDDRIGSSLLATLQGGGIG